MILTSGGRFTGYGFYLLKSKPVFLWNMVNLQRIKWEGPDALPPGRHTLEFDFKYEGLGVGTLAFNSISGIGRPGTGPLKVNGKEVATQWMEKTLPLILQWDESFDIGSDTLTGVNDADYQSPFPLTAKLNKLTVKVNRPQLSPEDIQKLEEGMKKVEAARDFTSHETMTRYSQQEQTEGTEMRKPSLFPPLPPVQSSSLPHARWPAHSQSSEQQHHGELIMKKTPRTLRKGALASVSYTFSEHEFDAVPEPAPTHNFAPKHPKA